MARKKVDLISEFRRGFEFNGHTVYHLTGTRVSLTYEEQTEANPALLKISGPTKIAASIIVMDNDFLSIDLGLYEIPIDWNNVIIKSIKAKWLGKLEFNTLKIDLVAVPFMGDSFISGLLSLDGLEADRIEIGITHS